MRDEHLTTQAENVVGNDGSGLAVLRGWDERRLPNQSGLRHGVAVVISRLELNGMTVGIGEEVKGAIPLAAGCAVHDVRLFQTLGNGHRQTVAITPAGPHLSRGPFGSRPRPSASHLESQLAADYGEDGHADQTCDPIWDSSQQ
jgi:hypothetical protein